jgi:hypothetical protein
VTALVPSKRGLSQLRTGWGLLNATYRNDLPTGARDVSGFQALQFRASVNYNDLRNSPNTPQNFSVILTDGAGATSSVRVSDYSGALFYPPGTTVNVPKILLNTVRIPLTAFTGINLTDVRSIQFKFDQTPTGALQISDLAFANAPTVQ